LSAERLDKCRYLQTGWEESVGRNTVITDIVVQGIRTDEVFGGGTVGWWRGNSAFRVEKLASDSSAVGTSGLCLLILTVVYRKVALSGDASNDEGYNDEEVEH
jgi:hypothetical protein